MKRYLDNYKSLKVHKDLVASGIENYQKTINNKQRSKEEFNGKI